jgi:hypothetical protein
MSSATANRLRSLKTLIGVRERRNKALEAAVDAAVARQAEAGSQEQAAQRALVAALAAEAGEKNKLLSLTDAGRTFDVQDMILRQHVAEALKDKVVLRQQDTERCAQAVALCTQEVRTRRRDVTRNGQKIDALKNDIASIRAARQSEDDDQQDEEAEEAAISRLLRERMPADGDGARR